MAKRRPSETALFEAVNRAAGDAVCVSVIVAAELRYGCTKKGSPELQRRVKQFQSEVPVLAFDVPADDGYGGIRADLEAEGVLIGSVDSVRHAAQEFAVSGSVVMGYKPRGASAWAVSAVTAVAAYAVARGA
jgi:tRNA(fMet)-specific endonuclease VapC